MQTATQRGWQMPRQTFGERFWAKVDFDGPTMPHMDTPCWVWTASLRSGYGQISMDGRIVGAHVAAWLLSNGPYPSSTLVLHHCDNRVCIRVDHLYLGTPADNMRDRSDRGRARGGNWRRDMTHCEKGHPLSGDNLSVGPQHDRSIGTGVKRVCKACDAERHRRNRAKRKEAAS